MRLAAVITLVPALDPVELTEWVERRWVQPEPAGESWEFHEIDIARVSLIYDLRRELDIAEDMLPMVLSLVDQVYEMRCRMRAMIDAVDAQPAEIRAAVHAALKRGQGGS
jgi:chaperone modulatory protein CbpM